MSFMSKYKGKYVKIDPENPSAIGVCANSDFVFNHKDLVKQMDWRGNNLVWTNALVGKPYADVPNPQLRPPITKGDPKAIKNPRFPQNTIQNTLNWGAPGIAKSEVQVGFTDPEAVAPQSYNEIREELRNVSFRK